MRRPKHSKPDIEEALQEAEDAGWRIIKASPRAKPWGSALCAHADRDGCRISIPSTPKSAQNFAKQFRKALAACPHQGDESAAHSDEPATTEKEIRG